MIRRIGLSLVMIGASFALATFIHLQVPANTVPAPERSSVSPSAASELEQSAVALKSLIRLPLLFEKNIGQADPSIDFIAPKGATRVFFSKDGFQMVLAGADAARVTIAGVAEDASSTTEEAPITIRERYVGASGHPDVIAREPVETTTNYFLGNDPEKWTTRVPNFGSIAYAGVYPGIDVEYASSDEGFLKDVWIVHPGADAKDIRLALEGDVDGVSLDEAGNLVVKTAKGEAVWQAPVAYQIISGEKIAVSASFTLRGRTYGFELGAHDAASAVYIDPSITVPSATYFGGSNEEFFGSVVLDDAGNHYLIMASRSTDLPTATPFQGTNSGGGNDVYIAKMDPDRTTILFATYIGGTGVDQPQSTSNAVVDASGNVYVAGLTQSSNFPTANAFDASFNGGTNDGFLTKLSSTGSSLLFSTYVGGTGSDNVRNPQLLGNGNVAVVGFTASTNFPVLNAYQAANAGTNDATVSVFTSSGSLVWSTYLGGSASDNATGLAISSSDEVVVSGSSSSTDFPTVDPFQAANAGGQDTFVSRFSSDGSALLYSTYFGGSATEAVPDVVVGPDGNLHLSMTSTSSNMPLVDAIQSSVAGGADWYFAEMEADGSALVYGTYYGGSGTESTATIALDASERIYAFGNTGSANIPTMFPVDGTLSGTNDMFLLRLAKHGGSVDFATFLGGGANEAAVNSVPQLNPSGDLVLAFTTLSTDLVATPGAYQSASASPGLRDIFIVTLHFSTPSGGAGDFQSPRIALAKSASPSSLPDGAGEVSYAYAVTNSGFPPLNDVSVSDDRCAPVVFQGGDLNNDLKLQSYETWEFFCSADLAETTTNTATAVGYANTQQATASASLTVEVIPLPPPPSPPNPYDPEAAAAESSTINDDLGVQRSAAPTACASGSLIKSRFLPAVFYCGIDGKRYVFPNEKTYFTWYPDFAHVTIVSDRVLADIPIGGNVTARPGIRLLKIQSDPKTYAVEKGGVLRWVTSEAIAERLYGPFWNRFVDDVPDAFWTDYTLGAPIEEGDVGDSP